MSKGIGGMGNLLKQAQEMQERIAKIQEDLAQKTVAGSAGGGMEQATVNGEQKPTEIKGDTAGGTVKEREKSEGLIVATGKQWNGQVDVNVSS